MSEGIVTPEAVLLEFSEAGLGSRSLAFLIDLGVRAGLLYGVLFAMGVSGVVLDETIVVVALIATTFAVLLVYPVVCETIWNGRTPGKMVVGLRVVTIEGAPVRFRHAAIRSALGIVDFLVGAGAVAILSALATRQSQRLGDLAAGTIVIRERQAAAFSEPIVFHPPPGWEPFGASLDVSQLSDEAYGLVRSFLLRVRQFRPAARAERAADLTTRVAGAIGALLPPGTDPEGFLITVAAAYQARHGGPAEEPPRAEGVTAGASWQNDAPSATWGTTPASS
ncbi:MAG: RDD family protein [Acidimicrobiales bacterium]